jgi:hypothetical protein
MHHVDIDPRGIVISDETAVVLPPHEFSTVVTGIDESAGNPNGDGAFPARTSSEPNAATIAPLSVHNPGRGTRTAMPAAVQRSSAIARSREFAATPPPISRCS